MCRYIVVGPCVPLFNTGFHYYKISEEERQTDYCQVTFLASCPAKKEEAYIRALHIAEKLNES